MSFATALLAPLMLLISAVGGDDERGQVKPSAEGLLPGPDGQQDTPNWPIGMIRSFAPESAWQVHIEQRMTIRITPRAAMPVPGESFAQVSPQSIGPRFSERKMGKCLPIGGIAGVEPNGPNNLILFMRDRRIINAGLERSCLARSFYSGFYLSRSPDGMLCVDRDTLLSRSGTACKLSRLRELVEHED